jgi:hypothetical protein
MTHSTTPLLLTHSRRGAQFKTEKREDTGNRPVAPRDQRLRSLLILLFKPVPNILLDQQTSELMSLLVSSKASPCPSDEVYHVAVPPSIDCH